MLLAEETAVEALRHSHTSSAATAWRAHEKIGEAWESATRTDVLLRHRHQLDGSMVRAGPCGTAPGQVDSRLSLPVRIRKGKVVVMTTTTPPIPATPPSAGWPAPDPRDCRGRDAQLWAWLLGRIGRCRGDVVVRER